MCEILDTLPYDDYPYLVYPQNPLKLRSGSINPSLRVFVHQRSKTFGDTQIPLALAGLDIIVKIYDNNGCLVAVNPAIVSDIYRSEVEYKFSEFDFVRPGVYYLELVFIDIDDSSFVLPDKNRIEVIVY